MGLGQGMAGFERRDEVPARCLQLTREYKSVFDEVLNTSEKRMLPDSLPTIWKLVPLQRRDETLKTYSFSLPRVTFEEKDFSAWISASTGMSASYIQGVMSFTAPLGIEVDGQDSSSNYTNSGTSKICLRLPPQTCWATLLFSTLAGFLLCNETCLRL